MKKTEDNIIKEEDIVEVKKAVKKSYIIIAIKPTFIVCKCSQDKDCDIKSFNKISGINYSIGDEIIV